MKNEDLINNDFLQLLQTGLRMASMEVSKGGIVAFMLMIDMVNSKRDESSIRDVAKVEVRVIELVDELKPISND